MHLVPPRTDWISLHPPLNDLPFKNQRERTWEKATRPHPGQVILARPKKSSLGSSGPAASRLTVRLRPAAFVAVRCIGGHLCEDKAT